METSLSVGIAVRDITPATPQHLHGYSARHGKSVGVLEPLTLRCLAVGDGPETVLVVSLDMLGLPFPVCQRLYALLAKETGVGFPHVLIAGTHTHFAPALHTTIYSDPAAGQVDPDAAYVSMVEGRLVEAAREALSRRQPAAMETVRVPVPGVLFNRRTRLPDGKVQISYLYPLDDAPYAFAPVDDQLTVLRFRTEQGLSAALVNFGCHPVTGTDLVPDGMRQVSSDYPYYLRRELESAWHCPVLFLLGAAGDTVPINRQGDCRRRIGRVLADTAVLAERRYHVDHCGLVAAECCTLAADTILVTDTSLAQSDFDRARAGCLHDGGDRAQYDASARALHRSRYYPENRAEIPIQRVQIGSESLVALPFEVLSAISLRMKDAFPRSVLVSCAGGYQGYLPLAEEFPCGGYGATPDTVHFAEDTGDRILAETLALLGRC